MNNRVDKRGFRNSVNRIFIENPVTNLGILFFSSRISSTLTESPVEINYGPSRETRWSSEMGFGLQKCSR